MRALSLLLVLAAAAACAPAVQEGGTMDAGSASATGAVPLDGTWVLSQVNGRAVPTSSPGEPNVTVTRGRLMLDPNGGFTMTITGQTDPGSTPREMVQTGSYTINGNALILAPTQERPVQYQQSFSGSDLVLRDSRGDVWRFTRG